MLASKPFFHLCPLRLDITWEARYRPHATCSWGGTGPVCIGRASPKVGIDISIPSLEEIGVEQGLLSRVLLAAFRLVPTLWNSVSFPSVWNQDGIKANSMKQKAISFPSPQVLVTIPGTAGVTYPFGQLQSVETSPKQTGTHFGFPCQNRSPAPWRAMRGPCSPPRLLADGTNANLEYPDPTLPLLSELEDFSRDNLDVAS